jgi:hypothetical protein
VRTQIDLSSKDWWCPTHLSVQAGYPWLGLSWISFPAKFNAVWSNSSSLSTLQSCSVVRVIHHRCAHDLDRRSRS